MAFTHNDIKAPLNYTSSNSHNPNSHGNVYNNTEAEEKKNDEKQQTIDTILTMGYSREEIENAFIHAQTQNIHKVINCLLQKNNKNTAELRTMGFSMEQIIHAAHVTKSKKFSVILEFLLTPNDDDNTPNDDNNTPNDDNNGSNASTFESVPFSPQYHNASAPISSYSKDAEEVRLWLGTQDLEQYFDAFMNKGCDSMHFVRKIVISDLETMGITKYMHIKHLLEAVALLSEGGSTQNTQQPMEVDT